MKRLHGLNMSDLPHHDGQLKKQLSHLMNENIRNKKWNKVHIISIHIIPSKCYDMEKMSTWQPVQTCKYSRKIKDETSKPNLPIPKYGDSSISVMVVQNKNERKVKISAAKFVSFRQFSNFFQGKCGNSTPWGDRERCVAVYLKQDRKLVIFTADQNGQQLQLQQCLWQTAHRGNWNTLKSLALSNSRCISSWIIIK